MKVRVYQTKGKSLQELFCCCCLGYDGIEWHTATTDVYLFIFYLYFFLIYFETLSCQRKGFIEFFLRKSLWGSPSVCGSHIRRSCKTAPFPISADPVRLRHLFHQTKFKLGLYWEETLWVLILLELFFKSYLLFIYLHFKKWVWMTRIVQI